jgi:hypothetical protein
MPMGPGGSRRETVRHCSIVVVHHGRRYERDLAKCRCLVLQRQIEGVFDSIPELADRVGLNPSTVYGWLRGTVSGTERTTALMLGGLGLRFDEVHRQVPESVPSTG